MAEWIKGLDNNRAFYVLKGTYIDIRLFDQGYAVFKGGVLISEKPYKNLASAKRAGERAWSKRKQG